MDLKEAMKNRHTVRKYKTTKIPEEIIKKLNSRIEENNKKYNISIKLIINDEKSSKDMKNYLILGGEESIQNLNEKLGYCGCDIMLYAQTLGLNTWWIGSHGNHVAQKLPNKKIIGMIVIGYGENNGNQHNSKKMEQVMEYQGKNIPDWFKNGINAALLAPTAMNKQDFKIIGKGKEVKIICDMGMTKKYKGEDTGLIKYHFELGAGKENFVWVE